MIDAAVRGEYVAEQPFVLTRLTALARVMPMRFRVLLAGATWWFAAAVGAAVTPAAQWTRLLDAASYGPGNTAVAYGTALDASGGIAVGGFVEIGSTTSTNVWWVGKYDGAGTLVWSRSADDAGARQWQQANGVAVAGTDTIAVGYGTNFDATSENWLVERYDATGAIVWSRTWNGPLGIGNDRAQAVAVDASGSVYVAGYATAATGLQQLQLLKYDPAGNVIWSRTSPGDPTEDSHANGVATDRAGNIIVAGDIKNAGNHDWFVVKYDTTGTLVWSRTWGGAAAGEDAANAVAVDASGTIYVTGSEATGGSDVTRWRTTAYDPLGNTVWTRSFNGIGKPGNEAHGVSVGLSAPNPRVIVAGFTGTGLMPEVWSMVVYDGADGSQLSSTTYDSLYSFANGVSADATGRIAVAGLWQWGPGPSDWQIVKYQDSVASFDVAASFSPPIQYTGGVETVVLTVTNTGAGGATGVTPSASVGPGGLAFTAVAAPVPAGPVALGAGNTVSFTWTFTVTGYTNAAAFTLSVTGTDTATAQPMLAAAGGNVTALRPASFQLQVATLPSTTTIVPGQLVTWTLTVTDGGDVFAGSIAPVMEVTRGAASVTNPQGSGGNTSLAAQSSGFYFFTATITAAGTIDFSITVTGIDGGLSRTITASYYGTLGATAGVVLQAIAIPDAGTAPTTDTLTVKVRVTNAGTTTASNVLGDIWRIQAADVFPFGGDGGAWSTGTVTLTRSDTARVTLGPGASHDFIWVYAVTGHGTIQFGPEAGGMDTGASPQHSVYTSASGLVAVTFSTLDAALGSNLPPVGKSQVRNGIIRNGSIAYLILHGAAAGGSVDCFIYSRAGLPLGRLGTAAVILDGNGLAKVPYDGTLDGKPLTTGMYWIVTSGAVKDRIRVMVVHDP